MQLRAAPLALALLLAYGAPILTAGQDATLEGVHPHLYPLHATVLEAGGKQVESEKGLPNTNAEGEHDIKVKVPLTNSEGMTLPVSVEAVVAICWLLLIGLFPFGVMLSEHVKVTKFHLAECVGLVTVLGGAVIMFTCITTFESSHWVGARSLTIVEAVYLITQIVTTVGYGDIVPHSPAAHGIVVVLIFFSMFLISQIVSGILSSIANRLDNAITKTKLKLGERFTPRDQEVPITLTFLPDHGEVSVVPMLQALAMVIITAGSGILFFHFAPGEEKTLFEALYMAFVTLSTTGFGSYVAVTPAGMAFAAFWMIGGVATLGNLVTTVVEFKATIDHVSEHNPVKNWEQWEDLVDRMDADGSGSIDELEFLKLGLVFAGFSTEDQVERVHSFFLRYNPNKDTEMPIEKVKELAESDAMKNSPRRRMSYI